ncbi:formin-binding protein 1 homolog isoform X9 [Tachypleus tridentatus]|uniref:formin-binding protein 1 homolog isoform X9 n=1 Tax=Tachypleus tridentatus TaxID=6853 RepID=UPI003FD5D1AB
MNWGVELWDQYDNLGAHTQRGVDFLDKYGQFVKDRCSIECEYANKLRRLVKNYQPKKKEEEDFQFTPCKAFLQMMNEVSDIAGQHELIAENMTIQIVKEINNLVKELKDDRKRHLHEGAKLQAQLQASLSQLDKAKKAYEKAFKEAEKAQENFLKADADLNLSRAEVEKARTLSVMKSQACEDCKTEYANQLQKTNELQRQHYTTTLPKVFQQLQDMDERRITCIQNFIKLSADIQRQVFPVVSRCLDGMVKASETVDPGQDSRLVIEKFKSGFSPPVDYPFEDLSNFKNGEGNTGLHPVPSFKTETIKGTITAGKLKKRSGIFGIFSSNKHHIDDTKDYCDLPPNQRKKKLTQKIEYIQNQIQQEAAASSSYSPESVINRSRTSIQEVDVYAEEEEDNTDFDLEPLPVLGTARALYPFDAQSEGSIPMEEGEEFVVVELDQGDGWTRVRRGDIEEGFVPTSYVQCFLYNNC